MLEALGVNGKEIICAMINFLILVAVLGKFLFKPMLGMLDQRRETIRESMAKAEQVKEEMDRVQETIRKELQDARKQSDQILADAASAGEESKRQIIEDARVQARDILDNARAEIASEKEQMLSELRGEVASMAAMAAAQILTGEIDEDKQNELMNRYLREVGSVK